MSENEFWDLIAEAKAATGKKDEVPPWLEQRLQEFPAEEIIDFSAWLATFCGRSYNAKLWVAASIIEGGLSYDGFFGFQGWLIAQGKAVYENALDNPDSLADIEFERDIVGPLVNLEKLFYTYFRAYNKKVGKPEYTTVELPAGYQPPPGSEPNVREGVSMKSIHQQVQKELNTWLDNPEKLIATFPKLAKRFKRP